MPQDDNLKDRYQATGELSLPPDGGAGMAPPSALEQALAQAVEAEKPTSADEWVSPRKTGFTVTLPTGNKMQMRRTFDVIEMMKEDGTVTNPLLGIIIENMNDGKPATENAEELSTEQQVEFYGWICEVVCKACMKPKVAMVPAGAKFSWEPPPGYIRIDDLSLEDQMFIWQVAQGGTTNLARFREESKDLLGTLQSIEDMVDEPISDGGD